MLRRRTAPAGRLMPTAAASLLLLLLFSAGTAATAAPAGSVVGLLGACVVESGGQRTALQLGASVQVGDTVDVPADGKLKLRLIDGSVVSVAAGSRLTVTAAGVDANGQRQNVQLALAQGVVRAVVTPVDHPAKFEVDTAVGTAAVRSTDWFVLAPAGSMQVGVLAGSVDMTSRSTGHSVLIPAGWGARLEYGRDPVPPRRWDPSEFTAVINRTNVP